MEKLTMYEMENLNGGVKQMSCAEFGDVLNWLLDNGHYEQHNIVNGLYASQFCG